MSVRTTKSAGWLGASALATLGAVLAMTLAPSAATAQERGQGRWGGENAQGENRTGRGNWQERRQAQGGEQGGGWRGRQAAPQAQPQVQVQQSQAGGSWRSRRGGGEQGPVQVQQQAPRQWQGNGAVNPSGRQGWRNRQAEQAQQQTVPPQGQAYGGERRRSGSGWQGGGWQGGTAGIGDDSRRSGRNRTYTDQDRNRSYRDGNRADNWRDNNRTENWRDQRQTYRDAYRDGNRQDRYRNGYNQAHRDWNRGWRNDNRYNWSGYRSHNRNHYRLGRYYSPYNSWSYRRLSVGFFLDDLFYSNRYWINDPWSYRLPDAYGPYRWVRYYDDALLVNIYTGEVVDVINDMFW